MNRSEFDRYADSYEGLLKDPIRDLFGGRSDFFHLRKRDLIRAHLTRLNLPTRSMRYLDVGCGKGELLAMLRGDFASVAGCDPSAGMLGPANDIEMRVQPDLYRIPYDSDEFDVVTAICVYHHVPVTERIRLTQEVHRVVKSGGIFVIIEHNPHNPITQLLVRKTPVDANAILLNQSECTKILLAGGFSNPEYEYFLYLPELIYRRVGDALERLLAKFPLGGQYAVFAVKNEALND